MRFTPLLYGCICLMGTALWQGCEKETTSGEYVHTVSGVVTDSLTAKPITGAIISIRDTTGNVPEPWLTDSVGTFAVPLYGIEAAVFARKEGYLTKWRQLTNVRGNVTNCDFQLAPE